MIFVATSAAHLSAAFADAFADSAARAIGSRGRFVVALTGGSTCKDLYPSLGRLELPWDKIVVVFGDERLVPPDHPESNFAAARAALLGGLDPQPDVRRARGELDGDAAAAAYAVEIDALAPIDLVHLGVGPDGHVCSLFPGHAMRDDVRVAHVSDSPKPPAGRVTLTERALAEAREVHLVAAGAAKASAVSRVVAGDTALPATRAFRAGRATTLFVDAASVAGVDPATLARFHRSTTD